MHIHWCIAHFIRIHCHFISPMDILSQYMFMKLNTMYPKNYEVNIALQRIVRIVGIVDYLQCHLN